MIFLYLLKQTPHWLSLVWESRSHAEILTVGGLVTGLVAGLAMEQSLLLHFLHISL